MIYNLDLTQAEQLSAGSSVNLDRWLTPHRNNPGSSVTAKATYFQPPFYNIFMDNIPHI